MIIIYIYIYVCVCVCVLCVCVVCCVCVRNSLKCWFKHLYLLYSPTTWDEEKFIAYPD
jgi:hypothetical protein